MLLISEMIFDRFSRFPRWISYFSHFLFHVSVKELHCKVKSVAFKTCVDLLWGKFLSSRYSVVSFQATSSCQAAKLTVPSAAPETTCSGVLKVAGKKRLTSPLLPLPIMFRAITHKWVLIIAPVTRYVWVLTREHTDSWLQPVSDWSTLPAMGSMASLVLAGGFFVVIKDRSKITALFQKEIKVLSKFWGFFCLFVCLFVISALSNRTQDPLFLDCCSTLSNSEH